MPTFEVYAETPMNDGDVLTDITGRRFRVNLSLLADQPEDPPVQPEPEPVPPPEPPLPEDPPTLPGNGLITRDDIVYERTIDVPVFSGTMSFAFGGHALTMNSSGELVMSGHPVHKPYGKLNGQQPTKLPLPPNPIPEDWRIGDFLWYGDQLVVSAYEFYDADDSTTRSHWKIDEGEALSMVSLTNDFNGGWLGGYMAKLNDKWAGNFGFPCVTGLCGVPIASRQSWGPSLFGFNPDKFSIPHAEPLMYYTPDRPLDGRTATSTLYNATAKFSGVANIDDTILFWGNIGIGEVRYGSGEATGDPYKKDKGYHAPPYIYQLWAYDAHDLCDKLQPHPLPYARWEVKLPTPQGWAWPGGMHFDQQSRKLYLVQREIAMHGAYRSAPQIHVFNVTMRGGLM